MMLQQWMLCDFECISKLSWKTPGTKSNSALLHRGASQRCRAGKEPPHEQHTPPRPDARRPYAAPVIHENQLVGERSHLNPVYR